jgi:hypothetical protein
MFQKMCISELDYFYLFILKYYNLKYNTIYSRFLILPLGTHIEQIKTKKHMYDKANTPESCPIIHVIHKTK